MSTEKLSHNIQEVQKHIMKYRGILEQEPNNFSAQLTLNSLEQHKKDLEYQLEAEREDYRQEQERHLMEEIIPSLRNFPQQNSHVEE